MDCWPCGWGMLRGCTRGWAGQGARWAQDGVRGDGAGFAWRLLAEGLAERFKAGGAPRLAGCWACWVECWFCQAGSRVPCTALLPPCQDMRAALHAFPLNAPMASWM